MVRCNGFRVVIKLGKHPIKSVCWVLPLCVSFLRAHRVLVMNKVPLCFDYVVVGVGQG